MNRRSFIAALGALPIVGRFVPKATAVTPDAPSIPRTALGRGMYSVKIKPIAHTEYMSIPVRGVKPGDKFYLNGKFCGQMGPDGKFQKVT